MSPAQYDTPFLVAADLALDVISHPEVEEAWDKPSALERMSVGMLTCHLARQVTRTAELLAAPVPSGDATLTAEDHYAKAAWVKATSLDDPAMDRSLDQEEAARGFVRNVTRSLTAYGEVRRLLGVEEGGTARAGDRVHVPWQEWTLSRDAFLLTRMVEIVTHTADLCASVDVEMPEFPAEVIEPVLQLLTTLALKRHGQAVVISTLTRKERTAPISAF